MLKLDAWHQTFPIKNISTFIIFMGDSRIFTYFLRIYALEKLEN
jgi:hypothetical protein